MNGSSETQPLKLRQMPRREFLRTSAVGAAGAAATLTIDASEALAAGVPVSRVQAWLAQAASATPEAIAAYEPKSLTPDELETLRAAVGRIIPTDDLGPGADQAGVHIFIDQALAGPDSASLPLYQEGLGALNAVGFAAADAETQDAILSAAESGGATPSASPVAGATPAGAAVTNSQISQIAAGIPAGFFGLLVEHTRQGMFGDPVWGGNANFAGWDLIGYPGIKLVWTEAEQEIGAVVAPEHISVEQYGGNGHE
jgi:gluconate 2-dehydrogenase gamma chain